jgi:hypothetical protein
LLTCHRIPRSLDKIVVVTCHKRAASHPAMHGKAR